MMYEEDKKEEEKSNTESSPELADGTGRKSIGIERVDDIPAPKVKRQDGLPTVDDLMAMMGHKKEEETMGDKVGNMVEIILKIK